MPQYSYITTLCNHSPHPSSPLTIITNLQNFSLSNHKNATMSQYHNIYQKIQPELEQIEKLRLTALKKKKEAVIFAIILGGIGLLLLPKLGIFALAIAIAIAALFYFFYPVSALKTFKHNFKLKVIQSVATHLEPSSIYSPYRGISQSAFKSTGHYRTGIDRYSSEDHFSATIGSTDVQFSEIHAEYKTTSTDSNGNTSTSWHDIFKGVLFIADFHKHFNTWLLIKPDNESVPVFGWLSKKIQGMSSSHIRMEDPDFEKHFKVNAGNDQQARYILTPDMQQRILELREIYGSKIIISFKDTNVYITAPKKADYYEPNLKESALNQSQISRIAQQIEFYFNIVKMLNLNTRIWTKE